MKVKTLLLILANFLYQLTIAQQAKFTASDVCESDSALFTNQSTNATNYLWRFGDGAQSTNHSPKHLYKIGGISQSFFVTLIAKAANGSTDSFQKYITVLAKPKSSFKLSKSGKTVICTPDQNGNGNLYIWGDGDTTSSASHIYTDGLSMHTICLQAINLAGCISQSCQDFATSGGISEINFSKSISINPNPSKGRIEINIETPENDLGISVYNLIGEVIKTIQISNYKMKHFIDLDVPNGLYIILVKNGNSVYCKKIYIEK